MKQTGGCIINTSSLVGTYASRMQTAYAASKFGINGLTKACARELGPYGIRVNAVAPAWCRPTWWRSRSTSRCSRRSRA